MHPPLETRDKMRSSASEAYEGMSFDVTNDLNRGQSLSLYINIAKTKARIAVLLGNVTETTVESCFSSLKEITRGNRRWYTYPYLIQRLMFLTIPFDRPESQHIQYHHPENYSALFELLEMVTHDAARDPNIAENFAWALYSSTDNYLVEMASKIDINCLSVGVWRRFFKSMALSPLECVILSSSILRVTSRGRYSSFTRPSIEVFDWDLEGSTKTIFEESLPEAVSEFSRPLCFGEDDLLPSQAITFVSHVLKIRGTDPSLAFVAPALVKYGIRFIQPLLKECYGKLFGGYDTRQLEYIPITSALLSTSFVHLGLVLPSPSRDSNVIEVYTSLLQLRRDNLIGMGEEIFADAIRSLPDSNLPRVVQIFADECGDVHQRHVLEMRDSEAQCALDYMNALLKFPDLLPSTWPPTTLRRLSMRLSLTCNLLPSSLFLTGVTCTERDNRGAGGFADIFCGTYDEKKVALKCLRVYQMMEESERARLKRAFYHESLLWLNLQHRHVCPFLGINEEVFPHSPCMVLPWAENGNIRHHLEKLRAGGSFVGPVFVKAVVKWLYQAALGLEYLHSQDVVHGDLRGVNILVEADGTVRLSDFGLSVIAEATNSFSSSFRGGAFGWLAPEIVDPEQYDLTSARPTFAGDVYSFGCVCVELFTCQPPYAGLSDTQIIIRVLRGRRPPRPMAEGEEMSDAMWDLTNRCWNEHMADRPSATEIVEGIERIISLDGSVSN